MSVIITITFLAFSNNNFAQVSITSTGTAFTENFTIGSSATATLPTGFKFGAASPDWTTGTTATTQAAGTTGSGALTGSSAGGIYNFADGVTGTSTDRAIGFLTSSGFTSPRSILYAFTNNTGTTITDLDITFDYEKYRTGTRAWNLTFFHGNTSNPTISASTGDQSYSADAANAVVNPPTTISKTVNLSGLSIAVGATYYLKWTSTGNGGSTNSQGIGIDNFSITAHGATILNPTTASISPSSATAGSGSFTLTVDGTNFISGLSTVTWNGNDKTTTFVNSTQLTASIDAADVASAGTANVGVTTTGAASPSNTQTFTINAAGAPSLSITGTPTDHGTSCVGTPTATVQYTITNSGTAASGVTVVSDNAEFVVSNLSSTSIAGSGGTATYDVTFTPSASGARSATITVASTTSGSNSPTSSLTGTGVATVAGAVSSDAATSIVNTTATLNGNVTTLGTCPSTTEKGFVYSVTATNNDPSDGGTGVTKVPVSGLATGAFTLGLTGLTPNTGYSYKAYVFDGATYTYGAVQTFTTLTVADHLAFNPAPAGTGNVSTNLTSFTVEARRADNSVDVEFTGTINLARNIVSGTANLAGTTSLAATAGVAVFNAVQFDNTGTYTITASSGVLTDITSGNITISVPPQTIVSFDFAGLSGNEASANSNFNDANLTSSTITRGAGLTASANADRFNATNWALTSISNAVAGNNYMEFTVTPVSGYQFSLTSIFIQLQRSATGLTQIALRSSVDNFSSDLDAVKSVVDNTSTQSFTFNFLQANSSQPITYRLYGYAEAGTGSAGIGDGSGDDIIVTGVVSLAPPAITTFTPTSGFAGSTVTITGANFTGATAVSFGGTPATSFTVDNATQITAVVGAGSTGTVSVTTPAGTGTSAGTFTFNSGYVSNIAGNWSSGATWLGGVVPPANSDVTIANAVTLDQNFTVGSGNTFTVATGGSLVIADNATLDMADNTGTINFNGQPVTVKSTATGTGSIGQIPGTLSGATNVTLERFIPQNATRGWRLLAANTSGQDIRNAWQEGGATVSDLGTQITGASTLFANDAAAQSAGFDKRTPGSSILFYDQPNDSLNALASTNVNIATHPAYFLYIRGDRSGDFTTNTTLKATTLRSTGTIVSGNQALNILPVSTNNTNGFNILGNPFASAIDMRTVMATRSNTTDISEDFQVWDPKVLGTYGLGGFQTFTRSGANYVVTPGGGSYPLNTPVGTPTSAEYNNIESGAGFVVTNGGASSGTITIAENAKVSASREVQRPAGTLAVPGLVKTNLYAMNTGSPVLADGNLVLVDDSYSNNVDIADARKIPNFGENFGIEKLGNFLAVEKRQAFVESDIIAFSMSKLKAVAYRLEITTEAVDAGLVAYLDDSYTKIQTPLSNQGTSTYDFTVTSDAASAAANRFQIVFKSLGGALPVSFIKFAATKANNDVVLEWKVGNQQGVSKYEVEKSTDGRTFVTMASVSAVESQDVYSWTDNNVVEPKLYYRVKAVEADGSSKLTDIASIVTNKKAGIKLVTNLARANEAVKLEFVGQQAGKYNIRLVNSLGQVMYRNFISYVGGSGYQQFTITSQLAGGAYQLEIVTPGKTKTVQRLVIQ